MLLHLWPLPFSSFSCSLVVFLFSQSLSAQITIAPEVGIYSRPYLFDALSNGVKQNKKLKFEINTETIKKIKTTDKYNTVLNDKEFVNANKVKRKISSPLEVLLYALAGNSVMVTKWKVKNEVSFDFIDNSLGQFYFNENDDIMVKFYFKSKNDLGNEILSVADYNSTTLSVTISK